MNILEKVSKRLNKYMAILVLLIASIALIYPPTFTWIPTTSVNWLLGIVMLGMGMTLKTSDFKIVFMHPREVVLGCLAQICIMPYFAWLLTRLFKLPAEIAIGVILVGTCPGGTSSNVMTYLAKGDVALSIGMTAISTLLAPFSTPALTYLLAGQAIKIHVASMFLSIIKIVILPIAVGVFINYFFSDFARNLSKVLPMVSVFAIITIVASIVAANATNILNCGLAVVAVVVLHNCGGYILGFFWARLFKMTPNHCKTISIEVGMQNAGLATSLAAIHFTMYPLATLPGAVFTICHNITGAIAANIMSNWKTPHIRQEDIF